jgi:NAD(P)-dependent dehydrogenase (short-subunit alcohol dehydrogenase family)
MLRGEELAIFGEEHLLAGTPLKRVGTLEDVAGVTIFLSSNAGAYITGVILPADGGIATLFGP